MLRYARAAADSFYHHRTAMRLSAPPLPRGENQLPDDLGQSSLDAHKACAEIAAAGHQRSDARRQVADGGAYTNDLGRGRIDARRCLAEIAAAGHKQNDAQAGLADGGAYSNLGHNASDIRNRCAEIAAAGHGSIDAQRARADGGTHSRESPA